MIDQIESASADDLAGYGMGDAMVHVVLEHYIGFQTWSLAATSNIGVLARAFSQYSAVHNYSSLYVCCVCLIIGYNTIKFC